MGGRPLIGTPWSSSSWSPWIVVLVLAESGGSCNAGTPGEVGVRGDSAAAAGGGNWSTNAVYLNMLNCFKDYKRYIHILNHIWLDPSIWNKSLDQQYMLSVLHSQYCACWCPGDFRSQDISRHGIVPQAGIFHLKTDTHYYIMKYPSKFGTYKKSNLQ